VTVKPVQSLVLALVAAAFCAFTTAPASASYDAMGAQRDSMIAAMGGSDDPACWETLVSTEDATWGLGFHYFDQGCDGPELGPHYLLRSNPAGTTWTVTGQVADAQYDRHGGQCPFGGVPTPVAEDFALCQAPVSCSRTKATADWIESDLIQAYARKAWPRYYGGEFAPTRWFMTTLWCADLTGDGHAEMIAKFECCTGGSPTPWGIYKRDGEGRWVRAYAQVRDTAFPFRRDGRKIWTRRVYRYDGAGTHWFQNRVVWWQDGRFRGHLGRVYDTSEHR
jgi:hypothetical protein